MGQHGQGPVLSQLMLCSRDGLEHGLCHTGDVKQAV